jgi:outer membrane protein OmpA-like peptidoglycan-associated protein
MRQLVGLILFLVISQIEGHPSKSVLRGVSETVSAETEGRRGILFQLSHFDFWYKQFTVNGIDEMGDSVTGTDRGITSDISIGFGYSFNRYFSFAVKGEVMGDLYITDNEILTAPMPDGSDSHEPDRLSLGLSKLLILLKGSYPLLNGKITVGILPALGLPISKDVFQERADTSRFFWFYRGGYLRRFVPQKTFYRIMGLFTWRPEERLALHWNLGYFGAELGTSGRMVFNFATEFYLPGASPFIEFHAERFTDDKYGKGLSWGTFGFRFGKESGASFVLSASTFLSRKEDSPFSLTSLPPWKPQIGIGMSLDYVSKPKPPKPTAPPPPKEGSIAGKVVDSETGEPIRAIVKLTVDTLLLEMVTDTLTGIYKFLNVPEGIVGLVAESEGYEKSSATVVVKGGETTLQDFELKKEKKPIGILTGKVSDKKTKEPLPAKITFVGVDIGPFFTDSSTGIYRIEVAPGTYGVKVEAEGYIPQAKVVLVKEESPVIQDFELLKKGMRLVFQNIYFNTGEATLKPESFSVLDSIALMLKENPDVIVEIQGHTDSRGSKGYNLKLSQARAEAVRNYLIKNHSISPERLIARGYGEERPIASNDTEEGRAKNRRVEFVILGKIP